MRLFLSRAAVAAGVVVGLATSAAAEPALFVARDADTTIYLYGTIHVVPCETVDPGTELGLRTGDAAILPTGCAEWMTDAVKAAFAAADELWLETPDILTDAVMDVGRLENGVLTDVVPEAELQVLAEVIAGPAADAVLPDLMAMEPWMVTTVMSQVMMTRGGLSGMAGVDISLARLAVDRGIPLRGFETVEEQLRFAAGEPLEYQAADLRTLAILANHDVDVLGFLQWTYMKLWDLWTDGDLEEVAFLILADEEAFFERYEAELAVVLNISATDLAEILREIEAVYEGLVDPLQRALALYESLVAQRNRNWMPEIREMLGRPGTFFVAVGAGHFAGDAAIQTLVAQEGATVERIQ